MSAFPGAGDFAIVGDLRTMLAEARVLQTAVAGEVVHEATAL